jgi:hypothetical protein
MKHLAVVVSAIVTFTTMLGLATPTAAHADPFAEKYVAVQPAGYIETWFWIDQLEGIIGCPRCGWMLDHVTDIRINPSQKAAFQSELMAGLTNLSNATIAATPEREATLRAITEGHFRSAARALGSAHLQRGQIGYFNPDTGARVTSYRSWLAEANDAIAVGIEQFQRGIVDPQPDPWFEAGMAQLDLALAKLSAKQQ